MPANQPLVLIEWEDSAQPSAGWSWLEESSFEEVVTCQSVGWLISDTDTVKALAPNRGQIAGDSQVLGVIRIPSRAVTRLVTLSEAS